jgi:N-glycosylase/DNA lyase
MQVNNSATLTQVTREYSRLVNTFQLRKRWNEMSEDDLWEELCLCILSSNVPYELALSAFWHLRDNEFLKPEWVIECPNADQKIAFELSKRIYSPRKKDGSCRKYRFPNVRATNIVNAAKTLYQEESGLLWILRNCASEHEAREFLAKNVQGIGLKEASHFLRNIGFSRSLAIIDSHVIAFLTEVGAVQEEEINALTPTVYMRLEKILLDLCNDLGFNLSIFDMAIWQCMRGKSE